MEFDSLDPCVSVLSWCTADVSRGALISGPTYFIFVFLPTWDPLVISMKDYVILWLTSWQVCAPRLWPSCGFSYSHLSSVYISQLQTRRFKARWGRWRWPWQPAGFTVWEAAANLSLQIYLQNATLHELKQWGRGRWCLLWVATLKNIYTSRMKLFFQNKWVCATVQHFPDWLLILLAAAKAF